MSCQRHSLLHLAELLVDQVRPEACKQHNPVRQLAFVLITISKSLLSVEIDVRYDRADLAELGESCNGACKDCKIVCMFCAA